MADAAVMELMFGASPVAEDVDRWAREGFELSARIPWGLIQHQGGPCGVLAAVQAFLLVELMVQGKLGSATPEQCQRALNNALANVIWRAKVAGGKASFAGEWFQSLDDLRARIADYDVAAAGSVLMFVKALIATRTIEGIRTDLGFDSEPLVSRFGHGSQELVNLCLFGRSFSHLFDGKRMLAPNVEIRGVPCRGRVGLLSQMEVLQYQKVGNWCRCPELPIWIIASSTHYTVLFASNPDVGQLSPAEVAEHCALAEFASLDQADSGFISMDDLPTLLTRLNRDDLTAANRIESVKQSIDPDGMGIALWQSLWPVLQERNGPVDPWACEACTFVNDGDQTICEMCTFRAPPRDALPALSSSGGSSAVMQNFTLYHYNGMEEQCTEIFVSLFDADGIPQGQSAQRGLREVIQTRWPGAIIDYKDNVEPRIT